MSADPQLPRRLASVEQLTDIVAAMRGIAAARAQQCRDPLDGVRRYTDTVVVAISEALRLMHARNEMPGTASADGLTAQLLFFSEQGFVGAFNEQVRVAAEAAEGPLYVIGARGVRLLESTGREIAWRAPMISQVGNAVALAETIERALIDGLSEGRYSRVMLTHMRTEGPHHEVVRRSLLPVDAQSFSVADRGAAPMSYLPPRTLFAGLAGEYLFAQLIAAVLESHAAENLARMQAMAAAQDNIAQQLERLRRDERIARQDAITDELIELAAARL